MAKEIKQRIVLEGEKEYNQAIKEAQRNLKTLKSELKAETAELGKNATEQQKAEAKAKSLKAQIAEQEKIVKTLREALKEAKAQYGENGEEVAKWEQKLNNARTTLANMKNDLDGTGTSLRGISTDAAATTVATKSVADALGQIGSVGDSVSGAIEDIFTSLIDHVTDAVVQLWDLISETAAKANNWTDIANYWGTNAQTIQGYARAVKATGNNFEDLQSAVTKLVLGGKGKKITELIGISDVNYKNDWDYAMAVMNQLYAMRERGEDLTPIYEQIFGAKKSTSVMDLLNDWDEIQRLRTEFNGNETGYGMSDEELETMDQLWVKINTIEEKWNAIKENIAAGFGKVSLDLLVNIEGTLDGIADYLNATNDTEKQAALDKIRANVEEFFTKLGEVIRDCIHIIKDVGLSLQESDDPLTSAIGDILVKLAESLEWLVNHADEVKGALETIFGIWIMGKLLAVAGQLGSIIMQIEAIKAFRGFGTVASAAEAAGTTAGASWGAAFGSAVLKAVPWLAGLLTFFENAITPQGNDDLYDAEGNPTELGKELGLTQTQQEEEAAWRASEEGQSSIWGGKGDRIEEAGLVNRAQYQALQNLWDNYSGNVKTNSTQKELLEAAQKAFEGEEEKFQEYVGKIYELRNSGERPKELPLEWFGVGIPEVEENISLDEEYTDQDRENAIQDWWDAWREGADDEDSAFDWFQEVFGDSFSDVWDEVFRKLDELDAEGRERPEDIPADWWMGAWTSGNQDGITSSDLQDFRGLPAGIKAAARAGVSAGISGLKVNMDGRAVGAIVAPYVSEIIARDLEE